MELNISNFTRNISVDLVSYWTFQHGCREYYTISFNDVKVMCVSHIKSKRSFAAAAESWQLSEWRLRSLAFEWKAVWTGGDPDCFILWWQQLTNLCAEGSSQENSNRYFVTQWQKVCTGTPSRLLTDDCYMFRIQYRLLHCVGNHNSTTVYKFDLVIILT